MKRYFVMVCIILLWMSVRSSENFEFTDQFREQEVVARNQDLSEFSNTEKITEPNMQIDQEYENKEEGLLDKEYRFEEPLIVANEDMNDAPIIAPPAPVAVVEPEEEGLQMEDMPIPDTQISSIDTTALENPQGNWLLKKMWWERAEERYEKLKYFAGDIYDKRVDFFTQRSTIDKDLFDTFYLELGMKFGEFSTIVNDLLDRLGQEQVVSEEKKEKQQTLLDSLYLEKATIERVKLNIDDLKKIDNAIENALGIVIETVNNARQYERDGWNCFKEISRLLDDKKAREFFYRLDVDLQNIKQLNNYLGQEFALYFSGLETRARGIVATLNNQLAELKEKGIDLRNKVAIFEQEEKQEQITEEAEPEQEEAKKTTKSWLRRAIDTTKSLFAF